VALRAVTVRLFMDVPPFPYCGCFCVASRPSCPAGFHVRSSPAGTGKTRLWLAGAGASQSARHTCFPGRPERFAQGAQIVEAHDLGRLSIVRKGCATRKGDDDHSENPGADLKPFFQADVSFYQPRLRSMICLLLTPSLIRRSRIRKVGLSSPGIYVPKQFR
jgi:hypothetical protein